MASDAPSQRPPDLTESSMTVPSDSENYSSSNNEQSPSPPSSSSSPLILYSPPTLWGLLRGAAINLLLPFVNGLMLGFGELLAHEAAFRLGWSGTKVQWSYLNKRQSDRNSVRGFQMPTSVALILWSILQVFPSGRSTRPVGPGVEMREDPSIRRRREKEMEDMTSLE
ncbi:MAG: hypothetical protein Q9181_003671 [Wetmoreana brouardii]